MMFDIANADDSFGYVHTDQSGRIGSIGTLCKVVDRVLQPDGQQYIFLEGISRFRVTKILKTLPYVLAEIEPELADLVPDETAARKLESEVYSALKYYMRLIRSYDNTNKGLVISAAAKKSRPSFVGTSSDYAARRTDFSFALANMIQMSEVIASQLLLQTTNVLRRLEAEKAILVQASEAISEQLISNGLLTAAEDENLKFKAFNTDDDDDILPLDIVREDDVKVKDEWDLSNME